VFAQNVMEMELLKKDRIKFNALDVTEVVGLND
jgi:hypothetical protein